MSDVVLCTADGSVFDDVTDLDEIFGTSFSNANRNQTDLELSVGNWHDEVIGWFVLEVVVVAEERLAADRVYNPVNKGQGVVWLAGRGYCDIIGDGGVHDRENDRPSHRGLIPTGMTRERRTTRGAKATPKSCLGRKLWFNALGNYPRWNGVHAQAGHHLRSSGLVLFFQDLVA